MTVFGTAGFLSTFGGAIMTKLDEFIKKAKRVHCGEDLDYSRAVYVNNRTPLCIIDHDLMDDGKTEYGEYWQTPYNHLRGQSHPLKRKNKISRNKSSKQEDVIRRFNEVHKGENLDYSKVVYKNMHTKVCIIDPEYGEYWQEPAAHLKGCGHPMRGRQRTTEAIKHLNYQPPLYQKDADEFEIIVEICNYLKSIDSSLIIEQHNRTILDGKEIDIYFPQKKMGTIYLFTLNEKTQSNWLRFLFHPSSQTLTAYSLALLRR